MHHTLYTLLVLANFPTIPADLKALSNDQFKAREAATVRLKSLPGWTVFYFEDQARRAKDQEVRLRCASLAGSLRRKWEDFLLRHEAHLVLAIYPNIPKDIEALGERGSFKERVNTAIRIRSLPGFTAPYFEYYARKAPKPEVRNLCERICKRKEKEWTLILESKGSWQLENNISNLNQKNHDSPKFWFNILTNLSKLSPEDLKLVEAQKNCPICVPGNGPDPLGCRGVPIKITLKGQTVFLCCKDCIKKAQADSNKTLANVESFKRLSFLTKKQIEECLEEMCKFSDDNK